MKPKELGKLAVSILVSLSAGFVGSIFTAKTVDTWYQSLARPWFAPPGWLISIIWTTLYILMGVSLYMIITQGLGRKDVKAAVSVFGVQLFLNVLWTYMFFGLSSAFYGLVEIIVLWIAIAATIYMFYAINKKSAYLLLPYIVWVTIAMIINYSIYIMN